MLSDKTSMYVVTGVEGLVLKVYRLSLLPPMGKGFTGKIIEAYNCPFNFSDIYPETISRILANFEYGTFFW